MAAFDRGTRWRQFVIAAIPTVILVVALTVWLGFQFGGDAMTTAVSDIGQAVPALAAALSCGIASSRSRGRMRLAWALLGGSAFAWGAGEVVWSYYTVALGVAVPFPSLADVGFLAAVPLAVGGLLAFPSSPNRASTRGRAVLDGAMVALSLLFISWALGLGEIYRESQTSLLAQWIGLAYPIGDIVILTVLFIALRRSSPAQRGRLVLLLAGLAANAFSDSAFAFLTASGSYLTSSYLFSAGWIWGYALVALAPLWPERAQDDSAEEGPITLWRMLLPWLGLTAVAAVALFLAITHQPMDPFLAVPGTGLVAVVMASQALSYRDSLSLLAESRRAQARLVERTTMLNQVIDHAPQGVARVNLDLRITNANPRLLELLNANDVVVVGSPLATYIKAQDVDGMFAHFSSPGAPDVDTFEADSEARRADGAEFWMHWSATAVRKPDGRLDYYLAMFDDITAKHEAAETAAANLAQLEKLNRLKSEFVSMVSHEFRTALVGVQGFSEVLRDEDVPPGEVHTIATDINNDAQRLSRMITEMLDLDRMEAGKIKLELAPLDLNALIEEAIERARVASDKHAVTASRESSLPLVLGDRDRLTQVMSNLLSNAIKYSPDGGEVAVATRRGEHAAEVTVTDHGLGIPPEFIHRIFGRYERFEDKHAGKIIGTGLGLAITRQIVEMHGGRIAVESEVGSGSRFTFSVPYAARS